MGGGWTDLIEDLVQKYQPLSRFDIPDAFWAELADYDRSVLAPNSLLNKQVKSHVQAILEAPPGTVKTAKEYIQAFVKSAQAELDAGNTVRLTAYNKGFDLFQVYKELGSDPKALKEFKDWVEGYSQQGKLVLKAGEEPVHRSMFEAMLADKSLMPRYARSSAVEAAAARGMAAEEFGLWGYEKHYAIRELVDDIVKMSGGQDPAAIYGRTGEDLGVLLKEVSKRSKSDKWGAYSLLREGLEKHPDLEQELMGKYRGRVSKVHGHQAGAHVRTLGLEFASGWRQELAAKELGIGTVEHRAMADALTTHEIRSVLEDPAKRLELGRKLLGERVGTSEAQIHFKKYLEELMVQKEGPGLAKATIRPTAALPSLTRSRYLLPAMAVAVGLYAWHKLAGPDLKRGLEPLKDQIRGRIEAIRSATTQWDTLQGITPSSMPGANQSDFGSGRESTWDCYWGDGKFRGIPLSPEVYNIRSMYYADPRFMKREAWSKAQAEAPKPWNLTETEQKTGVIDMSKYIYEMSDADSLLLRKAWVDRDFPVLGPTMGRLQKHIMNTMRRMSGGAYGGGVNIRVHGVDAPEVPHGGLSQIPGLGGQPRGEWATDLMEGLMGGADKIVLQPGSTYGRHVGTPMAGGVDIGMKLVEAGGAVASAPGREQPLYQSAQQKAQGRGAGIWSEPYFQGYRHAQKQGWNVPLNQMVSYRGISENLQAATAYSLTVFARNPHASKIRDPRMQNMHIAPYIHSTGSGLPVNRGGMFS